MLEKGIIQKEMANMIILPEKQKAEKEERKETSIRQMFDSWKEGKKTIFDLYLGNKTSKFCVKTGDLGNLPLGTSEQRKAFVLAARKNLPSSTPNESADSPKKN